MSLFRRWVLICSLLAVCGVAHAEVRVKLQGLDGALRDNVEARLSLMSALRAKEKDPAVLLRLHARAQREITEALQAMGYYSPEISVSRDGRSPDWTARYRVQAGPPTHVEVIDIEVLGDQSLASAVRQDLPLRQGQILNHGDYEASKRQILARAYQRGYLDAQLTRSRLRVEPARRRAEVQLQLTTGLRYFFGEVRVVQDILDSDVIDRYLSLEAGQAFDPQALVNARFTLLDLGYFSQVEIQADRKQAQDARVPIELLTEPVAAARYSTGIGYGTDTGARASAAAEFRRLNRRGHRLNTDLRVSEAASAAAAEYLIPLGSRIGEQLGFSVEYGNEKIAAIDTRRLALATALVRSPGDWKRRLSLSFEREEYKAADRSSHSDLLIPGVSFDRSRLDDPVHTRRGWSLFMDLHGAARHVLSDTGFLQARVRFRAALPVGQRSKLLLRTEWGGNLLESFAELPPSQRFFAGGDHSVRGYRYQSLGPKKNGEVIGGSFLTTASIEAETPIWKKWGVAAFFDIGGTDDDPNPTLSRGVGAGLRWRAPVGAIRLDLAHPLDGDSRGVRLHLGIRVGL